MCTYRHLTVIRHGDVCLVRFVHDRLTGELVHEVAAELYALADREDCRKLVVSLTDLAQVSSEMFGKLIMLSRRFTQKGGRLKLCEPQSRIREVFEQTKLDEVFDICESEAAALAAFD